MNPDLLLTPRQKARLRKEEASRKAAATRKAIRDEITKLLDENRSTIARRATLRLTNRVVMDSMLEDEMEIVRATADNLLDLLFEQLQADQSEGR